MTQRAIRLGAFATAVMAKTSLTEVALVGESMVRPTLDRRESTLGLARSIERLSGSGGASRKGMFQGIADMYQRVIILGTSDVGFAAAFDSWRGRSRQKTAVFSVDLHSSNGKVRTVQDGLHLLSGWTSTILDVIHQLEST